MPCALRLRSWRGAEAVGLRHLPAALLEALQGSWGSPEELGLAGTRECHLRLVAG
jgi:hypothetical protein